MTEVWTFTREEVETMLRGGTVTGLRIRDGIKTEFMMEKENADSERTDFYPPVA